jgi:HTH-type transcriptional regulator, competence development regulator
MMTTRENRLKKLRKHKGISGVEIAERLGVTPQHYYRYERGEQRLNEDTIEQLARIFNVSADYILGLTDEPGGHYQRNDVNVKELFDSGNGQFHWDGIPLGEKELKAAKEVIEYVLWKKIRGKE